MPFVARHPGAPPLLGAVAGAFVAAFFSFGGWWEVTKIAGEVRDPSRTLPRALWLGLAIVTLTYIAATLSFIAVVPIGQVAEGQAFIAQVGEAIDRTWRRDGRRRHRHRVRPRQPRGDADDRAAALRGDGAGRRVSGCGRPRCIRAWARPCGPSRRRPCWPRCSWPSAPSTRSSPSSSSSPSCSSPRRWRRVFVLRRREPALARAAASLARDRSFSCWSAALLLLHRARATRCRPLLGVAVVAAALPVYRMIHARRRRAAAGGADRHDLDQSRFPSTRTRPCSVPARRSRSSIRSSTPRRRIRTTGRPKASSPRTR